MERTLEAVCVVGRFDVLSMNSKESLPGEKAIVTLHLGSSGAGQISGSGSGCTENRNLLLFQSSTSSI